MRRVALKGMLTRRLRVFLTALSIVLGVAMVTGAYTLTDTMLRAADDLSTAAYDGTDAVVTARQEFVTDPDDGFAKPSVDATVLDRVRQQPGVEVALGSITEQARLTDDKGKTIGSGPYFAGGIDARDGAAAERLTPFRLTDGRYATGPGEVVIDKGTAEKQGLGAGESIRIAASGPARDFRIVGVARFGSVDSIGTATLALFDLRAAQEIYGKQGRFDEVLVAGKPGTDPAALRADLRQALGGDASVFTATEQDRYTLGGLTDFLGILQKILLAFGLVGVFVGAFIIFNTLSITVAQRTRELALLRSIGASRKQVMRSVMLEALVIGVAASLVGLVAGVGIAKGLQGLFAAADLELPQTDTVFATRTLIVGLVVGVGVTLVAALVPARRATRVAPVSVLREGATDAADLRPPRAAIAVTAIGSAAVGAGALAPGIEAGGRIGLIVIGTLVLFVGMALLAPRLVRPLARVLGAPGARIAGVAGRLARSNATRNPRRTAATAAALMIGVALVSLVAVIGHGLRESTTGEIEKTISAGHVLQSQDGWSGVDPAAVDAAAGAPGVRVATGIRQDEGRAFGDKLRVDGVDPAAFGRVYEIDWKHGDDGTLARLQPGQAIVRESYADKHDLEAGDQFTLRAATGDELRLTVAGIDRVPSLNPLYLGDVTIGNSDYGRTFATERLLTAFVDTGDPAAARQALAGFPDAELSTTASFAVTSTEWVDSLLGILYVLLALSVLISLFGIVNTLVLSVFERTRELGMLRAVGMTRRQVRRMIRHESVVTALIGATLGTLLGLALAGLATYALSDEGLQYAVPFGTLVAFGIVAVIAGMLAAILPARRAARLDVLTALQYE
jgi:putative ABC transport system permease protein